MTATNRHWLGILFLGPCIVALDDDFVKPNRYSSLNDETSENSRRMTSLGSRMTNPLDLNDDLRRAVYPETDPHVCLAFLSCCGRTDLLNHTIAGAIRHLEEDEPDWLRYELAWVDNGSGAELADAILDAYQIEHALVLEQNMGLAYGMNLLIRNLCRAPYILLLEEDWLYLDDVVVDQTPQRRRAIATAVSLVERLSRTGQTAFDGRNVMGVFLRPETYESILTFPHADLWETETYALRGHMPESEQQCRNRESCEPAESTSPSVSVDYRIFCADTSLKSNTIWGSYTNGAGLYKREDLMAIGRMYGEPGDAFHDRYVEGNYAFRAALRNCHAAVRMTDDRSCARIQDANCAGAFHHIGGGRGTRPMTTEGTICEDMAWNFYGTALYEKYHKMLAMNDQPVHRCTGEELQQLRDRRFRDRDAEEYREQVKRDNEEVFEKERAQRDQLREQSRIMLSTDPHLLRTQVDWMAQMSDEEIRHSAVQMQRLADSPHTLTGFWDSHGRVVEKK